MSFTIPQNLFVDDSTTIAVVHCNDHSIERKHIRKLSNATNRVLGVAAAYNKHNCKLSSIAFSTLSRVLVVNMSPNQAAQPNQGPDPEQRRVARSRSLIQDHLLLNPEFVKYSFRMDQLAVALYLDLSIRISNAVDMLSVTTDGRRSLKALMNAMGGRSKLRMENVKSLFFNTSELSPADAAAKVALKAWAACRAATLPHMILLFEPLPRINTMDIPRKHLVAIASVSRHADRLETLKPDEVKNEVTQEFTMKKGAIKLHCDRFSTRIKRSTDQIIQIKIEGEVTNVTGRASTVDGRSADIIVNVERVQGNKILSVTTFGKDDPTFAEYKREAVVREAMQHESKVLLNDFFRAFWLPRECPAWLERNEQQEPLPLHFPLLNTSQQAAVQRIFSDKDGDRIVVIQGPPGTGKTTVIAASVICHHRAKSSRNIWVAAQSNVGVKNIAEKFIKEDFHEFRLLVSKDFHYDWHEHLYEQLERCLIRSDKFPDPSDPKSDDKASRMLLDCKVVLCTLSMFSHPRIGAFLRILPVEMIVLDEASQIECGDYLPIFHSFHTTLSKLVFIGDNRQLPPFGQEDIRELRSIFEFPHLQRRALFLDTQYRMPHVIGDFISRNVYSNKLRTNHSCTNSNACLFIDVNTGRQVKMGKSWINRREARTIVKLARLYKSRNLAFRIITPYDAQRFIIERELKSRKLPWEDKVFTVDSFQGNEEDHIIISVVRSNALGFLSNQRRMNVMLTRCKKSMVICSSRSFLLDEASRTLVGKLAESLGEGNWVDWNDISDLWLFA